MGYYSFLSSASSDSEEQNSFTGPLVPPNRLIEDIESKYETEKIERAHCEEKCRKLQEEIEGWEVKYTSLIEDLVNAKNSITQKDIELHRLQEYTKSAIEEFRKKLYALEGEYLDMKMTLFLRDNDHTSSSIKPSMRTP